MTTIDELKPWQKSAAEKVAAIAGTHISNVDLTQFADMEAPPDNSSFGRMARSNQAYVEEVATKRQAAELEELKRTAAAALPGKEEIREMAISYGVSAEAILAQYVERKTEAIATLGKRQAAIEATKREGELLSMAVEFGKAKDEKDLHALIKIGGDAKNPGHQEARRVVVGILPGFSTWG